MRELFFYGVTTPTTKQPKRRVTIAGIVDNQSNVLSIGIAQCSHKDIFTKRVGRLKSLGRAKSKEATKFHIEENKEVSLFIEISKEIISSL